MIAVTVRSRYSGAIACRRAGGASPLTRTVLAALLVTAAALVSVAPACALSLRPTAGSPYATIGAADGAVVGDFNGDGKTDIAIHGNATSSVAGASYISVLLANGAGDFTPASGGPVAVAPDSRLVAEGDFTGDGKLDLLVANDDSDTLSLLIGRGDGSFVPEPTPITLSGSPGYVGSVAVADFNGDGKLDIAVANAQQDTLSILLGRGDGTFTPAPGSPIAVAPGSPYLGVVAADFNGDGRPDLAVAGSPGGSATVSVLLGNGDGTFRPAPSSPITLGSGVPTIGVGDLNGDGRPDLVLGNAPFDAVSVLLAKEDGSFSEAPGSPFAVTGDAIDPTIADLNSDGRADLAFISDQGITFPNSLNVLLGDGTGALSPAGGSPYTISALGDLPGILAVGQFDGRTGLVVTPNWGGYQNPGAVSVLLAPLPSDPPTAALTAPAGPALTGAGIRLDASQSSDPLDRSIVDYQWDIGSGNFDHDTGSVPTITATYTRPGMVHVRVKVTNSAGETAIADADLDVRPAPPSGRVGVSINNGDYATNTPHVQLDIVWPAFASAALISNDGGFNTAGGTVTVPLSAKVPWTLRSEGPERLPKIVYLRFPDSSTPTETFFDDILLDTLRPVVQGARSVSTSPARASDAREARRTYRVELRAAERLSGISAAQFSVTRSGGITVTFVNPRRRGIRELARVVPVSMIARPRYVRVRSAAGSWSRWHSIG